MTTVVTAARIEAVTTTLAERIEWILKTRGISGRELARRAGLREPHVSVALRRLRENPSADIEAETLRKLAKGGAVSARWLLTDEGKPDDADEAEAQVRVRHRAEWPSLREQALGLRQALGLSDDDVDAVGRMPDDELEIPTPLTVQDILELAATLRRIRERAWAKRGAIEGAAAPKGRRSSP